jgi:hypothetical protein
LDNRRTLFSQLLLQIANAIADAEAIASKVLPQYFFEENSTKARGENA